MFWAALITGLVVGACFGAVMMGIIAAGVLLEGRR